MQTLLVCGRHCCSPRTCRLVSRGAVQVLEAVQNGDRPSVSPLELGPREHAPVTQPLLQLMKECWAQVIAACCSTS